MNKTPQRKRKGTEFEQPLPKKTTSTPVKNRKRKPIKKEEKEIDFEEFEEDPKEEFKTPSKDQQIKQIDSEIEIKIPKKIKNHEIFYSLDSIQTIQSAFRGFYIRKQFNYSKEEVVILQSSIKGELERRKISQQKNSIQIIESSLKGASIRRTLYKSACKIQNFFKEVLKRKKQREEQVMKEQRISEACELISGAMVHYLEMRDSFEFLRILMERKCIVTIQSFFRGCLQREHTEYEYELYNEKATLIQKVFRGFSVRLRVNVMRKAIQQKKELEIERKKRIQIQESIIMIQSVFKGILIRKRIEELRNQSAIKIQTRRRIQIAKRKIKIISRFKDEEISKKQVGIFSKYFQLFSNFGRRLIFGEIEERDNWKKKVLKLEKQNEYIEKYIETPSNIEYLLLQKKKELEVVEKEKEVLKGLKQQKEKNEFIPLPRDFYEFREKSLSELKFSNDSKQEEDVIDNVISFQASPSKPRKKRKIESMISQPKKKVKSDEDEFKKPPLFPRTIVFKK